MAPNATQEKTERLLNLVVYLLGHKQGVTRATIRASMKEYQGKSDEAFERGFGKVYPNFKKWGMLDDISGGENGFQRRRNRGK